MTLGALQGVAEKVIVDGAFEAMTRGSINYGYYAEIALYSDWQLAGLIRDVPFPTIVPAIQPQDGRKHGPEYNSVTSPSLGALPPPEHPPSDASMSTPGLPGTTRACARAPAK